MTSKHFFFLFSLLIWCFHLSAASVSEQVQFLVAKQVPSMPINSFFGGKLGKFLFCLSCVVTLWLCEDCFLTCFI